MLKQLDIVRIISTKNIKFLSGPPGKKPVPHGDWSVVGFVGSDVLIAKDETLVRAPFNAIVKVGSFNTDMLFRSNRYGKETKNKNANN